MLPGTDKPQSDNTVTEMLLQLLESENAPKYNEAWSLFQAVGASDELASKMLTYLSTSDRRVDAERARLLFEKLPISKRTANDYLCAVKVALVWNFQDFPVREIYNEAASRGQEETSWTFALSFWINRKNWPQALEIWDLRRNSARASESQTKPAELVFLPQRVFPLLKAIQSGQFAQETVRLYEFTKFITLQIFSSQKLMMDLSARSIISLLEKLDSLQMLEARFYFKGLSTLQLLNLRSAGTRSLLLYRNLRWRLPNEPIPENLLLRLIRSLSTLEMLEGVSFLLDEYRSIYTKLSPEAYRRALVTYSRQGEQSKVHHLFKSYVDDYGVPSDLNILSPLLYVYARLGQVEKTREQFDRLLQEFKVSPNLLCWNILLTAHSRANDLDGALATFKNMVSANAGPDAYSFGILMGLLSSKGDINAVIDLFNIAKQNSVRIRTAMVDTVVSALCRNRRYSDAEKVADEAFNLCLSGSLTRMWNILLWNHAFTADVTSVSRIQASMQEKGIEFDGMTYAALMLSLIRIGKIDPARQILRKLHRSRHVNIAEIHYAILLRGYLTEGNRDMISILYGEMVQRFGSLGLSGNLSMLRVFVKRDLQRFNEKGDIDDKLSLELTRAEQFLDAILNSFDISSLATKQPQPGTERRSATDAFPSAYYEPLLVAYGSQGEFEKVKILLDKRNSTLKELSRNEQQPSLKLMHLEMLTFLREGKHDKVESCWNTVLGNTINVARPMDFKTLIPPSNDDSNSSKSTGVSETPPGILPSYRYALSRCISVLMQSLSYRNLHYKIADVISRVENLGFVLTTFNWSLYVKLLCLSRRPDDQLRAFTVFEDKFISNFLGWGNLKRGRTKRPDNAHDGLDFLERRYTSLKRNGVLGKAGRRAWARIQPDSLQPTYLTMLYLGSALIDFRSRSIASGSDEMGVLLSKAPNTVSAVAELPFLREKFQGVILRGRQLIDDPPSPIDTKDHVVWTGGVLGIDGESRIDTSPEIQDLSDVDMDELKAYRESPPLFPPGEDNSEPEVSVLENMLDQDLEWRALLSNDRSQESDSDAPPPLQVFEAQDELDLELEAHDENQGDKE
ncbi:hypothetical protein LOZ66_006030 [Ophidiomyces ophidiicola]|nr:hypothetical protein LOZ65_000037 [Ophidiomyces ophidiicola]KAI1934320.1 hypothetical protein LOZ66_006030 [Ophidiomyces ophidiicola]